MSTKKSRKSAFNFFRNAMEDPFAGLGHLFSNLFSMWLVHTYPFASIGEDFYAHYRVDLKRQAARYIAIGNHVTVDKDVWLNIAAYPDNVAPMLILSDGCRFSRRCVISAKNNVWIGPNCMFGPSVFITDHNHAYEDVTLSIRTQGTTDGGKIRIEEGCWIGSGAAIVCEEGELIIGQHSVIGANSVVTRNVPPYSVAIGHPARIVKQFDHSKQKWVIGAPSLRSNSASSDT